MMGCHSGSWVTGSQGIVLAHTTCPLLSLWLAAVFLVQSQGGDAGGKDLSLALCEEPVGTEALRATV